MPDERTHLVLRLSQELLPAKIIESQTLSDTGQKPTLECSKRRRHVIHFRAVKKRERSTILTDLICM